MTENSVTKQKSLTMEQQKALYLGLYDRVIDLHSGIFKPELKKYTDIYRTDRTKGIILLDYTSIQEMIESVKNKNFYYQWVSENDAKKIKYAGISAALLTMNAGRDCVLVCSLSLGPKHIYVNCTKFKDIAS